MQLLSVLAKAREFESVRLRRWVGVVSDGVITTGVITAKCLYVRSSHIILCGRLPSLSHAGVIRKS